MPTTEEPVAWQPASATTTTTKKKQPTNQSSSSTDEATPTWLWLLLRRPGRGRERIGRRDDRWKRSSCDTQGVLYRSAVLVCSPVSHWCPVAPNWAQRRSCPPYEKIPRILRLITDQFPLDQLIDSIDWPILLRNATQPAEWSSAL